METAIVAIKKTGYVSEILTNLYLGDIETSQDESTIRRLRIKHIINLSNEEHYKKWDNISYTDIPIEDNKNVNISEYIKNCVNIIENCRQNGENILVHCFSGVSRSVSIILSYLVYKKFTLKQAFEHVKSIRINQYTLPNIGFFKQLIKYEKEINDENTMNMNDYVKLRN